MLRFFQKVATNTGSVLATTVIAHGTYRLGSSIFSTVSPTPSENPPKPAGELRVINDNSTDRVVTSGSNGPR